MKQINIPEKLKEFEFAEKAAKKFKENDLLSTFTEGDIKEDAFFAVRWGLSNDCVLVFKVGCEPVIYTQIIKK